MKSQCNAQTYLCGLRISTVRVDAWGNTCRGDDRGVVAFISCQREHVFGCEINAEALHQLSALRCQGISKRDIVELEVVALLKEIA